MTEELGSQLLLSPAYRAALKRMYREQEWGGSGHKRVDMIEPFVKKLKAGDVLDYGCGQGLMKRELNRRMPKLEIREYDPGIIGKDALPEAADLVVCTDVLEHIEPPHLDNVLLHLRQLAKRGMFLLIATRPANKCLPDGRNAHLIIETPEWWIERIQPVLDMGGGWKIENQKKQFWVWTWAK